jgi:hypothetical protein
MSNRASTIIISTACVLALSFVPKNMAASQSPKDGMQALIPVPSELGEACEKEGCYVVTQSQMEEFTKNVYLEGYSQCRREARI